jgi:hypothetical protein
VFAKVVMESLVVQRFSYRLDWIPRVVFYLRGSSLVFHFVTKSVYFFALLLVL